MLGVNNVCLCSPHPHAVSISTSSRPLLMLLHLLTPHFILVGEPEKQGTGPSEKKKSQETRRNCNCVSPCCTNTVSPRTFHTEKKKSHTRLGRLHLSRHTVRSRAALHRTAPQDVGPGTLHRLWICTSSTREGRSTHWQRQRENTAASQHRTPERGRTRPAADPLLLVPPHSPKTRRQFEAEWESRDPVGTRPPPPSNLSREES